MKKIIILIIVIIIAIVAWNYFSNEEVIPINEQESVETGTNLPSLGTLTPTVTPVATYISADGQTFDLVIVNNGEISAANIVLDGVNYTLNRVVAASGAKYEDAEGNILWENSGEITLTIGGVDRVFNLVQ
jgi:membrane-bound inhibitor of C-type lysozyme